MWGNNEGSNWNPNASYPPPVSGNVDWAALAQQWIAMKGQSSFDLPPVAVPPPPTLHHLPSTSFPPPNICAPPMGTHSSHLGEANMDLDEEEENEEEILKAAPEPAPKPTTNRHRKHQSNAEEPTNLIPQKIMNQKSGHSPTIDANARKKLPPWIREGLEKMEKEKQKKEQMEKRQREREEVMRRIREEEEEEEEEVQDVKYTKKGRARIDEDHHPEFETEEETNLDDPSAGSPSNGYVNKSSKSKEELLEAMTITLRRTLTEILLEVTSSEIQNVCAEILDKYRRRQSGIAVKGSHQKALGQLLSGYASDEDRQSSDGSSVENESRLGSSSYSDEDNLESIIRRKKREFEKTSEKINSICAAKEENFSLREKRWIDEGEYDESINLAHIYGKGSLSNTSKKDIDNSEEREEMATLSTTSPLRSKAPTRRNRSKERKCRENHSRRSVSSDRRSRSKERSSHRERRSRSKERYSHDRNSPSRERRLSYDKSSRRSVSRERNTSHIESSRKHKSKSSKHTRESRERSRDIKTHRRHSRDDKRKRRKRSRHSSSSSSSPSPIRSSSSKKSRRRKRSRS